MTQASIPLANPLLEHLGVRLIVWGTGQSEFELDIEPQHLNRQGALHGGVVATLLDAACGYAGVRADDGDAEPDNAVTVMLNISYVASVDKGRLRAVGRVVGGGRRIYYAAAELLADDGRLIATANGAFKRGTRRREGDEQAS